MYFPLHYLLVRSLDLGIISDIKERYKYLCTSETVCYDNQLDFNSRDTLMEQLANQEGIQQQSPFVSSSVSCPFVRYR